MNEASAAIPPFTPHAAALLENPFWHALGTEHASLAIGTYLARRYPSDVIPFAAIAALTTAALDELQALLVPGESIYITGQLPPTHPGLHCELTLPCLQMVYAPGSQPAAPNTSATSAGPMAPGAEIPDTPIHLLGPNDLADILELKRLAFPGYFGPRAPSLGAFYGIRIDGQLVSMAGERLALPGMREVSAVCTHPAHTGRGYSARLIRQIVGHQLRLGALPFLQVASNNARAIALYGRLGFVAHRELLFHRLHRPA